MFVFPFNKACCKNKSFSSFTAEQKTSWRSIDLALAPRADLLQIPFRGTADTSTSDIYVTNPHPTSVYTDHH
jgi:hypothetical protein